MSSNSTNPQVRPSQAAALQAKASLLRVLKEKSKTDPDIASLVDELLGAGLTAAFGASISKLATAPTFALVQADHPGWHAQIPLAGLHPGQYRLVPSAESRYALNTGTLVTGFHGLDATMDGNEMGIPKNPIRIGGLISLIYSSDLFGGLVVDIIDFPPGKDWEEFRVEGGLCLTDPIEAWFVIADRGHGDNSGVCRVDLVRV